MAFRNRNYVEEDSPREVRLLRDVQAVEPEHFLGGLDVAWEREARQGG